MSYKTYVLEITKTCGQGTALCLFLTTYGERMTNINVSNRHHEQITFSWLDIKQNEHLLSKLR